VLSWPPYAAGESPDHAIARVHRWALAVFVWTPDSQTWAQPDHVPTRNQLEQLAREGGGRVHDDCDGFAALCRYALWDLRIPNRMALCNVESAAAPPTFAGNHAVAIAPERGLVLDCRFGVVTTRGALERLGYEFIAMSGLEPDEPWVSIKRMGGEG
jgi:hypothetical protein